jgi:hypothetical protein
VTDTNVFQLSQPGNFADPLTEVLKGARALLAQAVEAEAATWLSRYADETTDDSRKRLVRHLWLRLAFCKRSFLQLPATTTSQCIGLA